jgi:hypothetical protein
MIRVTINEIKHLRDWDMFVKILTVSQRRLPVQIEPSQLENAVDEIRQLARQSAPS